MKIAQEERLNVAEMNMLGCMCGVSKIHKVRHNIIRVTTKVLMISKNIKERGSYCQGKDMLNSGIGDDAYDRAK